MNVCQLQTNKPTNKKLLVDGSLKTFSMFIFHIPYIIENQLPFHCCKIVKMSASE